MITIIFDIILNGQYQGQITIKYLPCFDLTVEDIKSEVETKFPTLRGTNYKVAITNKRVRL